MDDTAVVIGAGMSGLSAATALSSRYAQVIVLDRDELPGEARPRRGVPQSGQPHILLASGLRELSTLLPGFDEDLVKAGGVRIELGAGLGLSRYGRRSPVAPTGIDFVSATRPQMETLVRSRLLALPGVTLRDQVAVSGLTGADGQVTGVVLDDGSIIPAALVVDCSGRGSRSDRWLAALDLPTPAQLEVKISVSYATRFFRRRDDDLPGWLGFLALPDAPREHMSGLALPVEGDRWVVTVGGWHLAEPPSDVAEFEACARSLPDPAIADLIDRAEPLGDLVTYRFPSSRRRLFEKLPRQAAGYVTLGDAMCSFNPIYGQGMTCAVHEASMLGATLDRHARTPTPEFARDYYTAAGKLLDTPWGFAVGADFVFPETSGPKPAGTTLRNWYATRIGHASQVDAEVNRVFNAVQQLITPPSALTRPSFVARVFRGARQWKTAA